jgi:hypothetical protein
MAYPAKLHSSPEGYFGPRIPPVDGSMSGIAPCPDGRDRQLSGRARRCCTASLR